MKVALLLYFVAGCLSTLFVTRKFSAMPGFSPTWSVLVASLVALVVFWPIAMLIVFWDSALPAELDTAGSDESGQ